jgi:carbamoyl-phosphate synthase large subunit
LKIIPILFLGASKRVSLLERFEHAASGLGVKLKLYSCELDEGFYPISALATVLGGPPFLSEAFPLWLRRTTDEYGIEVVIPNMDSATVALSRLAKSSFSSCWAVVSSETLCESMHDKILADRFFRKYEIPVPPDTPGKFPKILKPRLGFGAKNIRIVNSSEQLELELSVNNSVDIVQDFLSDVRETTVDIYMSPRHGLRGYVLRDRIEVSDGEVMVCRTRPPRKEEKHLIDRIAGIPGWQGCITLQYVADVHGNLYVIEINPRFGGGATCAIEAGLDMSSYILIEHLGEPLPEPQRPRNLIMSRARRDFFHEY